MQNASLSLILNRNNVVFRIHQAHNQSVREELSALRKHMSVACHQEIETLEAKMKAANEETQMQLEKHFKEETKSLKDDLARISRENQALQGQLAEVLQLLRSKPLEM
jgi:hypothetical protein